MLNPLAQTQETPGYASILWWSIGLIITLVVSIIVVARFRRWLTKDDEPTPIGSGGGFTLSDLRDMHRQGQISDAEYERCRAKITAVARRGIDKPPGRLAKPPESPESSEPTLPPSPPEEDPPGTV